MWNLTIQLKMITEVTDIIIIIKHNLVMGDNLSLNSIVILSICELTYNSLYLGKFKQVK